MHTVQVVLVELEGVEDKIEEPKDEVEGVLLEGLDSGGVWFDYVGSLENGLAGRGATDNFPDGVLRYSDNPKLAEWILAEFVQERTHTIDRLKKEVDAAQGNYEAVSYPMYLLGELMSDIWGSDSGLYDITAHSTDLKFFRERVTTAPENQYLVVVDFHH